MRVLLALCLINTSLIGQQPTQKQSSGLGFTLALDYMDMYMFRGRVLDPDTSLQGRFTLGLGSWSYNLFHHAGSSSTSEVPTFEAFEEYTHSVEYTTVRGNAVNTMGYRLYTYSAMWPDTQEIFYRIAHYNRWNPSYGVSYDIEAYRGTYIDFSLSRFFPLSIASRLEFDFDLGLSTGMEEKSNRQGQIFEYGPYSETLNHGSLGVKYQWAITPKLTFHAGYIYQHAFDDKLRDDPLTGEHNDYWSAGLRLLMP
ncbi:MAG: hypothetical protein KDC35_04685 [Acidobacteria bacterium]|nr:hypothetical protein [Acidobacteriota bacterium]